MEQYHVIPKGKENLLIARDDQDYQYVINQLALSGFKTNSEIYAYTIMSNHIHLIVESENISPFTKSLKESITKRYNHKYNHKGAIFEENLFFKKIETKEQCENNVIYILKNPVHHKINPVAFEYPYSSINLYFPVNSSYHNLKERCSYLLAKKMISKTYWPLPKNLYLDIDGHIIPQSFVKTNYIKSIFYSHRNFNYKMNKPIDEEVKSFYKLSEGENVKGLLDTLSLKSFKLSDQQLCNKIDTMIQKDLGLPRFSYSISEKYRLELSYKLIKRSLTNADQASRCLGLDKEAVLKNVQ